MIKSGCTGGWILTHRNKDMMMTMVMMMMIEKKKGKDFPGLDRGRGRGAMSLQCADPAWSLPLAPTY